MLVGTALPAFACESPMTKAIGAGSAADIVPAGLEETEEALGGVVQAARARMSSDSTPSQMTRNFPLSFPCFETFGIADPHKVPPRTGKF
ncbi:hypothetical protein AHIS1636_23510 [Arthrobacter mangrovi]|uniref:Uncharacterized protein n=1 Tax=Arthrobacter mangrovi TaxID=2966350 RepID=A0ABQ5MV96_9MICC|nr:hypothetical protein AHIS1636_23510 [Arthrobacter mangrovi]